MTCLDIRALDRKIVRQSNVRIIKCGKILEVYEYEIAYIYNLGKLRANEAIEEEDTPRAKRDDNLQRAQRKIKRLINSNVWAYGYHPIFVTYTFADNVQDIKIANRSFKTHTDRLRKTIVGRSLRYLAVPELQKRGAIHYHVVYFDLPYIAGIKDIFAKSWNEGWVQVKAINHVRNVGAYVSKYFGKQWATSRLFGGKNYFSSEGLYQPEVYRTLDILEKYETIETEHMEVFTSPKYGKILYRQLKIKNTE